MSDSQTAKGLTPLINNSARLTGKLQNGINKVLWGSANVQPARTATYDPVSGSIKYSPGPATAPTPPAKTAVGSFVQAGLFNALDVLNSVDLCSVMTYLTDTINAKKSKRPPESEWSAIQATFYGLQDQAEFTQKAIDKFTAYPNIFIGSYVGTGPNAVPPQQAISESNAPAEGGSKVTAYNLYFLMQSIKDTFSFSNSSTNSLFTEEDKLVLSVVPGLGGNLNIIDDFIGTINKYSDYRQIPNDEVQKLLTKVTNLRSICVTIQNLDFKVGLAAVGNFIGVDVRAQIQKLNKFLDPTKIITDLKNINNALRTFIRIGRQVEGILKLGQFIIKLALIFAKVFKFIQVLFTTNPFPLIFATGGVQTVFQNTSEKAKTETNGIIRLLKSVNALLTVVLNFLRYLLVNTNELLSRLDILLINLQACDAVKDSDVVSELKQTQSDLIAFREQITGYITQYDSKTNANTAMFGKYDIRVVEEEITDPSIRNKRRRGVALDTDGQVVVQSDLTFATNNAVIIAEVQQQLIAQQLVSSNSGQIDAANLAVIAESVNYLDSNDVIDNDLTPSTEVLNAAGAAQGANISQFIDKIPGGPEFKQNSKTVTADFGANAKQQAKTQATAVSGSTR
jgi:hypothetical protein